MDRRSWALSEKGDMSPAVAGIKDPGLVWRADLLLCPVRDPGSTANELQERRDEGSEGGWWAGAGTPPEGARGLRLVMSAAHSSPSLDTVPIIPYMPEQSVGDSSEVNGCISERTWKEEWENAPSSGAQPAEAWWAGDGRVCSALTGLCAGGQ